MFSFSEDMLPRHFPKIHLSKSLKALDETTISIPQPTLPSVSLIFSSENNVNQQQSLRKWNDRCHATLQTDSMKHQSKPVKKHVRFVANNGNMNRYNSTARKEASDDRSKVELTSLKLQQRDGLYQRRHVKSEVEDNIVPFETGFLTPQLTKENCDRQPQLYGNSRSRIAHLQADDVGFDQWKMIGEQRSQSHSSDEILLNILEEQQRHILMQRNQILMQEIQSLEQQKQICFLEYQVKQLLLQNEADVIKSQQLVSTTNVIKTKNKFPLEPLDFGYGMSSGLVEDANNEKNAKNFEIHKIMNFSLSSEHFLFDRTDGVKNSAIFYHKFDEAVSSNPHSSAHAANTTCSSYGQSQLAMERSLVLNMLTMKYNCSEGEKPLNADQFCDDVPLDVQDYLVRHGLIKRQI